MIVVFTGADGSGKSTVIRILRSYLTLNFGKAVCVHWLRGSHLLASILLRLLSLFKSFHGLCSPYYKVCIPDPLKKLWTHIEFWSLIPHLLVRYFLSSVCNVVLGDRGVIDFIVWLIATLNDVHITSSIYGRFLLRLASIEKNIYLHASIQTLIKRADMPPEFVRKQVAIYRVLSKYFAKYDIDTGEHNPAQATARVLRWLSSTQYKTRRGIQ